MCSYPAYNCPTESSDGKLEATYIVGDVSDASQAVAVAYGASPVTFNGKIREVPPSVRPTGTNTFEVAFSYIDPGPASTTSGKRFRASAKSRPREVARLLPDFRPSRHVAFPG
jgi:hypothetical protein